jgi:hypothetical protein
VERTSQTEPKRDAGEPADTLSAGRDEVAPGIPAGSGASGITVPARVVGLLLDHGRAIAIALVVVLSLGALTGVDAWLGGRRETDLAAVVAAYRQRDCAGVLEAWRQASRDPVIPGRRAEPAAGVRGAVDGCRALQDADRLAAAGDADRAFAAYLRIRRSRPESPLAEQVVGDRLVSVLASGHVTAEPGLCRELRGTVAAKGLRRADAVAPVLTACGQLLAGTGADADVQAAFVLVSEVRRTYPKTPSAPAAATVEANLRLRQVADAPHTATTPFHASVTPANAATVRFVNHSPWPVTLTLAGPGGGRVISLPACPSCGPYLRDISWQQCLGKGSKTDLRLPPGRFEMALQYSADGPDPSHGFWNLQGGWYEECYFFVR